MYPADASAGDANLVLLRNSSVRFTPASMPPRLRASWPLDPPPETNHRLSLATFARSTPPPPAMPDWSPVRRLLRREVILIWPAPSHGLYDRPS